MADESFQAWYLNKDDHKAEEWLNWIKENPMQESLLQEAIQGMQTLLIKEKQLTPEEVESAHDRLMQTLRNDRGAKVVRPTWIRRWGWVAAAVVFLAIAGSYYLTSAGSKPKIRTAYGQVQYQKLPDGTEVTLNANSTISYTTGWDKGNEREVWINGEAFFHVKKTTNKSRFIVHADQLDVVVTGTQFNVVSRNGRTNVMLTEGSVILHTKDGAEIRMEPGDFVEFNNNELEKKEAKEEAVLAWRDKKMVFENTPLEEVMERIREHYGVEIEVEDETLNKKPMSGIFPNDNLDVLLKMMEATAEFKVTRKENKIILMNP